MILTRRICIAIVVLHASILMNTAHAFAVPPTPAQVKATLEYPAEQCSMDMINLNAPHQVVKQADTRCCPYDTHYCSYPKG